MGKSYEAENVKKPFSAFATFIELHFNFEVVLNSCALRFSPHLNT